jgi:signal transduction histidine kinase/ligand-binding sensor domain-containing protein
MLERIWAFMLNNVSQKIYGGQLIAMFLLNLSPISYRRLITCVVSLIVYTQVSYALDPMKSLTQYRYRVWQSSDGLPYDSVRSIAQSRDGYIWLATDLGLARFDGVRFTSSDEYIARNMGFDGVGPILTLSDGSLIISTHKRLFKYDGKWSEIALPETSVIKALSIEVGTGAIWVGTKSSGVYRILNNKTERFCKDNGLPSNHIQAIYAGGDGGADGSVWLASGDQGLIRLSKSGEIKVWGKKEGLVDDKLRSVFNDNKGNTWVGSDAGYLYQIKDTDIETFDFKHLGTIHDIYQDRDGNIWLGTDKEGLCRLRDKKLESSRDYNLLPDYDVRDIHEDIEGNLWIGTRHGGIIKISNGKFRVFSEAEGIANDEIQTIYEDKQSVLVGTHRGITEITKDGLMPFKINGRVYNEDVKSLYKDSKGNLWISARNQPLITVSPKGYVQTLLHKPGLINSITEDVESTLWFGSSSKRSLYRLKDNQLVDVFKSANLQPANVHLILADSAGHVWVATEIGILQLKGERLIKHYDMSNGLANNAVRSLYMDQQGDLWIGMHKSGLQRLRGAIGNQPQFSSYTTTNGLCSDGVYQIREDLKGNLWFGSRSGIFTIKKSDFDDLDQGEIKQLNCRNYDTSDGMKSSMCNMYGNMNGLNIPRSVLRFPTMKGVVEIDTERLTDNRISPIVVIESLAANGEPLQITGAVKIGPGKNNIEIRYTGLSFTEPRKVRFRYMLEGFDAGWINTEDQRMVRYSNLSPGEYRFLVMASNNDGLWSSKAEVLAFTLKPHFYQTYWFKLFMLLAAISVVFVFHYYRLKRVKEKSEAILAERNRLARELHDTLLQGFAGITLQLESVAGRLLHSPILALKQLNGILPSMDKTLKDARQSIWSLRNSSIEETHLINELRRLVEEYGKESALVEFKVNGEYHQLPSQVESQIIRISQEAITNALKHAQARRVELQLTYGLQALSISIKDDGRGFDSNQIFIDKGHFGLMGMRERAEIIGATLQINSQPNLGTTVGLKYPLKFHQTLHKAS